MAAVVVLVAVIVASVAMASGKDEPTSRKQTACGTKVIYGRTLTLWVVGRQISCAEVAKVVADPCADGKKWSCASRWPPAPVLVWIKSAERFARQSSTTIEARRYPCSEARVTAAMWRGPQPEASAALSYHQLLADDLVRCGQLKGKSYRQVIALLGRPLEGRRQPGAHYADWMLGAERDSMFQVDSEYLTLRFDAADRLRSARLTQG
jgi:hypothetical protein